ncbi:MAG: hypothetical protein UT32_C0015G0010 [Parcubacteria group bacterium GW2011_GWC2_39_14]|nr:MAG: hypothetical protein UT32_C0015G0010 [Parcubacteria group bacterium GW2011_GWC2_39_14]KKR54406.1 MAG: hypothetical protein UT91_C0016G0010 [Parcubacteria group bacterium GW2011_GWA2_40_23]
MNFENFGNKPERKFNEELGVLGQESFESLRGAEAEDRAAFLTLKKLENEFLKQSL